MNKMYKYLQEHSYISENKKSNYQSELSEQRAECIANKYNSLVQDLEQENQKYKEVLDKVSSQIKLYGKYNGEKCTRGFSMMSADFNKLLDLLKEVSE